MIAALLLAFPSLNPAQTSSLEFERVIEAYSVRNSSLLAESISPDGKASGVAFNWTVGVVLSAWVAAVRVDPGLRPGLIRYADAVEVYWNSKGPVPGYDVLPGPKPIDRYYDDNAWLAMALVEIFELTKGKRFLDRAEKALIYALSGEDAKLGGGIYWRESDKASKNTCSNAPVAAACLAVAKHRNGTKLRAKAREIYEWTHQHLRDPADGLYWDSIDLNGKIEKTKWSYNSALMLRTARELRLPEAKELAKACHQRWVDPESQVIRDEGRFAHLLFENLLPQRKAIGFDPGKSLASIPVGSDGWYGKRWDRLDSNQNRELIDQVSYLRAKYLSVLIDGAGISLFNDGNCVIEDALSRVHQER
jgi:hypothetical protein